MTRQRADGATGPDTRETVLIACAGGQVGHGLSLAFARAGARVIVVDHDDCLLRTAQRAAPPDRVEPLRLNLMKPDHIGHFTEIWTDTPLTRVVLCQFLRFPDHPALALRACTQLATALAPALRAGGGQATYMFQEGGADPASACLTDAAGGLAARLQGQVGPSVPVNGLRLSSGRVEAAALHAMLAGLNAPGAARVGGACLPVLPPSD